MDDFERAVIKALAYADLFEQPLSIRDLWLYLVGHSIKADEFERTVRSRMGSYEVLSDYAVLSGRADLVKAVATRREHARRKMAAVYRWRWLFALVPWVKMVAVTGSVAGGTPGSHDDIDILVITSRNRLWLSRFIVTGLLTLLGKRRKPNDDPARVDDKFCLNMWLSEDGLASEQQNLYVANELSRMKPVLNRDQMYERYIAANRWVERILPNFFDSAQTPEPVSLKVNRMPESWALLSWLDRQFERWQLRRMRPRTRETVTEELLMFHPHDYSSEILQRYERKLNSLGVTD
jgi:hypothetical protein